jgi:hypothetical protein
MSSRNEQALMLTILQQAKRYRFLRDHTSLTIETVTFEEDGVERNTYAVLCNDTGKLYEGFNTKDEAVDAAMAARGFDA